MELFRKHLYIQKDLIERKKNNICIINTSIRSRSVMYVAQCDETIKYCP